MLWVRKEIFHCVATVRARVFPQWMGISWESGGKVVGTLWEKITWAHEMIQLAEISAFFLTGSD